MNCNERHIHPRDGRLEFDEPTHTYTVDGEVYDSVTTVVEGLFKPFDADYWAARKTSTPAEAAALKAEWEARGKEARDQGTLMHSRIEAYYLGETPPAEWLADSTFGLFAHFATEVRLCPLRTEWRIYHEESRLAGTLDFLAIRPDRSLEIWDWKRSSKLVDASGNVAMYSRYGDKGLYPVEHLDDTTYNHYALQVSIYRYILEKKYGLSIAACKLGVFHPDNRRYHVIELPYRESEAATIIKMRINAYE